MMKPFLLDGKWGIFDTGTIIYEAVFDTEYYALRIIEAYSLGAQTFYQAEELINRGYIRICPGLIETGPLEKSEK